MPLSHRRRLAVLELAVGLRPASFLRLRTDAWDRLTGIEAAVNIARNLDQADDSSLPRIKPKEGERVQMLRQAFEGADEPPMRPIPPAGKPSDEQLAALVQLLVHGDCAAVRKVLAEVGALPRP
jgi:hypothetical protein